MTPAGGLTASYLGPATSPGSLLIDRFASKTSDVPLASSSRSPFGRRLGVDENGNTEEIIWQGSRVVYSRSREIVRQWSFEGAEEGVNWAGHVWLPTQGAGRASTSTSLATDPYGTFGPFHRSQHAKWDGSSSSASTTSAGPSSGLLVRAALICLKSRAEVYYPSGEHATIPLPFPIDAAFPLPQQAGGGVILQRKLKPRELRRGSVLNGLKSRGTSALDLLTESHEPLPRLYTLSDHFDELTVVEVQDKGPLEPCKSVHFVSDHPYPFVIAHDSRSGRMIFYSRLHVPLAAATSPAPADPPIHPGDLVNPPPSAPRPSLQRTASTFSAAGDRRTSAIGTETKTMDRTRRGPRVSRGGIVDPQPPTTTAGELQAVLDPPALPSQSESKMKGRGRPSLLAETQVEPNFPKPVQLIDLRETTMMMGLEREEQQPRSETMLKEIFAWSPPSPPESASIFLSENLSPDHVFINVHIGDTLHTFQAKLDLEWTITPLRAVPASSAIPILSTRDKVFDTLILHDHQLHLITSNHHLLPVSIPQPPGDGREELTGSFASRLSMLGDRDESMGSRRTCRISHIGDAVGSRFNAYYNDREAIRVGLDLRIRDDLVRRGLESLSWLLPEEVHFAIRRSMLSLAPDRLETNAWGSFERAIYGTSDRIPKSPSATSRDPTTARLAGRLRARGRSENSTSPSFPFDPSHMAAVILSLHLVAQDLRLSQQRQTDIPHIGRMIVVLADACGRADWADYWRRLAPDLPGRSTHPSSSADTSLLDAYASPPDVLAYLGRRLTTPLKPFPSPQGVLPRHLPDLGLTKPCAQTADVIALYERLGATAEAPANTRARVEWIVERATATISYMVENGLGHEWLSDLPPAVALPIQEIIRVCQNYPPKEWSPELYEFVDRQDLAARARGDITRSREVDIRVDDEMPDIRSVIESVHGEKPGHSPIKPSLSHVRFGEDRRVAEVERIMQTTIPRTISVQEPQGASDADVAQYQQSVVNTIANRTLSIPAGQGIFEYGTRKTTITDTFDIPLLELSVKVVPGTSTLQAQLPADNAEWPCFHNGVSVALSISSECEGIDSSWIVFNRPTNLNPEHGGFLLGLGLTGHLRSLATYHAYPYMEPRHDFTSVGLLLGLACSFAGSQDHLLTKILSLHTHAYLPLGSMDLNATPIVQCASMVGLGLIYAGSKNLRMAEVALGEVGRKEMSGVEGFMHYEESYSFSCAVAFGLIMLGRGSQITSDVDRRMLARLTRCIVGQGASVDQSGPPIDTSITAPGATLALCLMYLKTNRRDIANILEIPSTVFDLDHVRPDILLLRTFARAMIMWDDIAPSRAWVETQIPSCIDHKDHKKTSQLELELELAYINIVAGACLAIGLKYAGTATELAHTDLLFFFGVLTKAAGGQSMTFEGKIRRSAARQGLNVVTIALCAVMSGTGELNVLRRLRISHGQEGAGVNYGSHMAMHMALGLLFLGRGHYTLGSSNLAIAAMAISFFPRFLQAPGDNKAYPQAFRHLWALAAEPRCLIARDVETRETIYLPVKLTLRDGGQNMTQSLISPTLIAPFDHIVSIEVDSPRYWPVTYDLSNPRDRHALVSSRTIFVKRKAGFLSYNSDPKGNRSIFVRTGSMSGFDLYYDLISPSAPPTISPEEVVQLITVHSGDPALVAMAERFQGDTTLERAMRIVLLECVSLDKPHIVPLYMGLLLLACGRTSAEAVNHLAFLRFFYSSACYDRDFLLLWPRGERQSPLVRVNTVTALYRHLSGGDVPDSELTAYLDAASPVISLCLAVYLLASRVPSVSLLAALRESVRATGADEMTEHKVRASAMSFADILERQWDLTSAARGGSGEGWAVDSLKRAMSIWLDEQSR